MTVKPSTKSSKPKAGALPDLLFFGDSHTIALEEGAQALGLNTASLNFGGSAWADGKFGWNEEGFNPRASVQGRRAIEALRERFGVQDVFSLGIPVVTTAGFHLGRLIRPFDWHDHQVMGATDRSFASGLVVSDAMIEDYVVHYRAAHLRLLKRIGRSAKLVAIAPPELTPERNFWQVRDVVIRLMKRAGIEVFDPIEVLYGTREMLPAELIIDDGAHASAEYGTMAMRALRESGWLN